MKSVITAIAMATLFASPVLAKTPVNHHRAAQAQGLYMQAAPAYRAAPTVEGGRLIGQDPDANVRGELNRDYGQSMGAY